MKLVNVNNQGVVEVSEVLAERLLGSGVWVEFEEPSKARPRGRGRKQEE